MTYEDELLRAFQGSAHLTAAELRRVDQCAMENLGLPGLVLMENAGLQATAIALGMLPADNASVVVFCGAGNNGGDGYVIARQLHLLGVSVRVLYSVELERLNGDARINAMAARDLGIGLQPLFGEHDAWSDRGLAIDALLGTGLKGPLRMDLNRALEQINRTCLDHGLQTLAIDLPTGLCADSGEAAAHTFRAQQTVTFAARKLAFQDPRSSLFTGVVTVVSIGVTAGFVNQTYRIE